MMISCKKATELMSREMDQKLPFLSRTALKLHVALCANCKRAWWQFRFLGKIAEAHLEKACEAGSESALSEEARDRICAVLKDHSH